MSDVPLPHTVRIGVFDSGLGGLSVLRAIHEQIPSAEMLYVADSGHAPYGERSTRFVEERSQRIANFLHGQGAQVLVVACNTATAAAVEALRRDHPEWRIVGVEPGIKPAAALTLNGRVGVMATASTLRSGRFQLLAQAHAADIELFLQPCPGLAAAIESGALDAPEVADLISRYGAALKAHEVDTVVLGCTHYPFVANRIAAAFGPAVRLVDTAQAVARRTAALCREIAEKPTQDTISTEARLWTSGDPQLLAAFARRWLQFPCRVERLPAST